MSDSNRAADSNPPATVPQKALQGSAKKPRSPVERAIVWGGILVLLIVVLIESKATHSLASDRDAVLAAIDRTLEPVTESQVEKLVTRYSTRESQTGLTANELSASRVDTYRYGGLIKKRILYIYFGLPRKGHEQEVLQISETPIRFFTAKDFPLQPVEESEATDQPILPGIDREKPSEPTEPNEAEKRESETGN